MLRVIAVLEMANNRLNYALMELPDVYERREGGSSKQYLVVKKDGEIHARFLTVREAARLMGAPDSFILPGSYNDGYKAMGDAVAMPVAQFIGERFLIKIAEAIY